MPQALMAKAFLVVRQNSEDYLTYSLMILSMAIITRTITRILKPDWGDEKEKEEKEKE